MEAREQFTRAYDLAAVAGKRGNPVVRCLQHGHLCLERAGPPPVGRASRVTGAAASLGSQTFAAMIAALDAGGNVREHHAELLAAFGARREFGEMAALLDIMLQAPGRSPLTKPH